MAEIFADGVEINVSEGTWRVFNLEGANSLTPFFSTVRGTRLLQYVPSWGEAHGLPGDVLGGDYVQAVIVGFDQNTNRWNLGIQVALTENAKPQFVPLVRWPAGDNEQSATDSHRAARALAEYIGCQLKLFGVKKSTLAQSQGQPRGGVTGPLNPHQRTDIEPQRVRAKADLVPLPIELNGYWLGSARNTLTLRVPKDAIKTPSSGEAPAYNQCVIDKDAMIVRLMPPTGLLGAFLGPQGRAIKVADIRNVELRYSVAQESSTRKAPDGMDVDVTNTHHIYGIYLTLAEESLMIAQLTHIARSELNRHQIKSKTLVDGDYNAEDQMAYLRLHQKEQQRHDDIMQFAENAANVIAASMMRPLVKTEPDDVI